MKGTRRPRRPSREIFSAAYEALFAHFGPQHWWPGDTPFEMMVGAILTQNTSWSNVERAIGNLRAEGLLDPLRIAGLSDGDLARRIRPAGYFNVKARRLRAYVDFYLDRYGGVAASMKRRPLDALREELLGVYGVGPETADSILLYAFEFPVFVVDAYTKRVFSRHGLVSEAAGYDAIQQAVSGNLPRDAALFNEYHALIVRLGKERCRKSAPVCGGCPLEHL